VLDVERVALVGAPWFAREYNELGTAYFASQGFRVISSQSAGLSQHPRDIEHTGVRDWTSQHVDDDAEAVFIGGNGFRAARAIDELEAALGRPVLTSNQVPAVAASRTCGRHVSDRRLRPAVRTQTSESVASMPCAPLC